MYIKKKYFNRKMYKIKHASSQSTFSEIFIPLIYDNLADAQVVWPECIKKYIREQFMRNDDLITLGFVTYPQLKNAIKENLNKLGIKSWDKVRKNKYYSKQIYEDAPGHLSTISQHIILAGTADPSGAGATTLQVYAACQILASNFRKSCGGSDILVREFEIEDITESVGGRASPSIIDLTGGVRGGHKRHGCAII